MWIDTHLEQPCEDQEANAEPCDRLEPFLHGFQKDELCFMIQRPFHRRQDKQHNSRKTAHPGHGGQHVKPVCERNSPGRWSRHYGEVPVGVSVGVSVGSSGVLVGTSVVATGTVGGVTSGVRSMVGVGGKQTGKSSS